MNASTTILHSIASLNGDQTMHALTDTRLTMTSLQIAELVESRHDSVKRTSERLAHQSVIAHPPTVDVQETGGNNRTYTTTAYVFTGEQGKRDSIIVVAQLSPEFTARLVDRWQELEQAASQPAIPQNLPEALRLAADLADQKLALEHQVAEQAPKVQGFDRIANAEGLLSLRETATTLKVPERQFILWMQRHDWLYRRAGKGTLLGYAERIKEGYLEHKAITIHNDRTGSDEVRESVRVTPLGLTALSKRLHEMQEAA